MRDPILITGAARSGTSLVAGMIQRCGAVGGDVNPNANQRAHHENNTIRNQVVKPYLKSIDADPLGQYPLPDIETLPIPRDWRSRVMGVLAQQGLGEADKIWYYKGAKMALMWPVWAYAFPNAKWIIVRRRSADIANSCCRTGFMQRFRDRQSQRAVGAETEYDAWIWWVRQHELRFREMIEAGLNVRVVWPERMVQGDYQPMYETIEWLGLEWSTEALAFIDPKLWKPRQQAKEAVNG